ncbi:MAG: tRNA (adenosine(37)-N6)-threonylcarbamoyltransferase complex ATPase subunit type 1 TsaE [Nitrolancea sp.]
MPPRRSALDVISHSPDQTRQIGFRLGRLVRARDVLLLAGQVGAGKTTLVQGLARGLNVDGYVQSPTFALAAEHVGKTADDEQVILFHLDFYRLEGVEDFDTFGYEEYLDAENGIVVIEWPERLPTSSFDDYLLIELRHLSDSKRRLVFRPSGERYMEMVEALRAEVSGAQRRPHTARDR